MPFKVEHKGITKMDVDCIVNAANTDLLPGGGVCGFIFKEAGYDALKNACDKIGHVDTGKAVITPGFNLKAKYIIHTAGPIYTGSQQCEKDLYNSYFQSLLLAKENGIHSIAFPLISGGIYGYPKDKAFEVAKKAISDFLGTNDMDVFLCLLDHSIA